MKYYQVIRSGFGGSEVFDEEGRQVGYSLPEILGDSEIFYDMAGNPVGQSFNDHAGGFIFTGIGNDSHGYMDREINTWLDGDPFGAQND